MRHHESHARLIVFVIGIFALVAMSGLVIQFGGNADASALAVGSQSVSQGSNGLVVEELSVEDSDLDGAFDVVYTTISLKQGSGALLLEEMLVQFASPTRLQTATYKGVYNCDALGAAYAGAGKFNAQYLTKSPNYEAGVVQPGDVVRLCFGASESFDQGDVEVVVVPSSGTVGLASGSVVFSGNARTEVDI